MPKNNTCAQNPPYGKLAILWLAGWTLRVPILATPPLATRMAESFRLGDPGVGALTMLPIIAVAFGAVPAAWIVYRLGVRAAIAGGIAVMVLASMARGQAPSATFLFTTSFVMGLGVALFQTALPLATRVWTPTHVALGSAVYLNGMMLGELSAAGLTLPLVLPLAGDDWRLALVIWAVPVSLIAVLVMLAPLPTERGGAPLNQPPGTAAGGSLPRWDDGRVWQLGLLLGGSVVAFFVVNAYAGTLLQARNETEALKGLLFSYNAMPLMASFLILKAPHWIGSRGPIAVFALLAAGGMGGFIVLESWASWISALVVGFAATAQLILLTSLPPYIATGAAVTRLSAGMTLIGFTTAFLLTWLGGWVAEAVGSTGSALLPAFGFMIVTLVVIGRAGRYSRYG